MTSEGGVTKDAALSFVPNATGQKMSGIVSVGAKNLLDTNVKDYIKL